MSLKFFETAMGNKFFKCTVPGTYRSAYHVSPQSVGRAFDGLATAIRTHLISSLIAFWRSDAEQTQAQSGSEPN